MARTGMGDTPFRACQFYHCASVPPDLFAGIIIQAPVPRQRGSVAGDPAVFFFRETGKSGRIYCESVSVQSNNYWSSTTNANNTDNAWNVNLNNGNVNNNYKDNDNYVWPVRGGK